MSLEPLVFEGLPRVNNADVVVEYHNRYKTFARIRCLMRGSGEVVAAEVPIWRTG